MRKIMTILAVLALAGAVSAQKKKPAAKPAAKIDDAKANAEAKAKGAQDAAKAKADAAQADLAAKAAAATAVDESKFSISVWGGYNITGKSDYVKAVEVAYAGQAATQSNDSKLGGIAGGADFFYGGNFQIGASVGYLKGHDIKRTVTNSGNTYVLTSTMDYAPILLSARYFVIPGLYVGAGVGVASVLNGVENFKKDGVVETINLPGGASAVDWNFKYSGTAIVLQGRLGYDYAISSSLSIGIFGAFTYVTAELDPVGKVPASTGNAETGKGTHNSLLITPALAVTFKF